MPEGMVLIDAELNAKDEVALKRAVELLKDEAVWSAVNDRTILPRLRKLLHETSYWEDDDDPDTG